LLLTSTNVAYNTQIEGKNYGMKSVNKTPGLSSR
jgi:hypothetical protein